MIDPNKITNYNLNTVSLQEYAIFWLLVAGKTAKVIAKRMEDVIEELRRLWRNENPKQQPPKHLFVILQDLCKKRHGSLWLAKILKKNGIGCHTNKAKGMIQFAHSKINLKTCSPADLETIHGIGFKSSRCFILHSRENAQCSGLDTHLLGCLKELGYNVPDATPSSKKKYLEIENIFLDLANKTSKSPAKLDLLIWRVYSSHKHLKPMLLKCLKKF